MLIKENILRSVVRLLIEEESGPKKDTKQLSGVGKAAAGAATKGLQKGMFKDPSSLKPSQECYDSIWKHESPVPYVYDDGKKMSEASALKKYGNIVNGPILQNIIKNKWPAGKMPFPSNSFEGNTGFPTIGAGHLIKTASEFESFKDYTLAGITSDFNVRANSSIPLEDFLMSEEDMKDLFEKDVDTHTQFKSRIKEKITQSMFDALTSLAFNSGWEKNRPIQKVINLINFKKYKAAQEAIKNLAITSKGEVMQGLVNRRKEETEMFGKEGVSLV